jgi:hypothetical protein
MFSLIALENVIAILGTILVSVLLLVTGNDSAISRAV